MPNTHGNSATGVATGTNTETAALTISPAVIISAPSGEGVMISGSLNITAGTGTTAVAVRCRRGVGVGGTQVGPTVNVTLAAGNSATIPFDHFDTAASATQSDPVLGDQWTITVQQTGGTAAGTVNYISAAAESCNAVE